jgi:group I intron endonuclease
MYCVYITTNLINQMQYVGMHRLKDDVVNDGYLGSGSYFSLALKKYGRENFSREILAYNSDLFFAHQIEAYFVNRHNTVTPFGYNLSLTGGFLPFGKHSESSKRKISESGIGDKNHFYGKKHTDKTKKKISIKKTGHKQSEETINRRVISLTGLRRTLEQKEKIYKNHNYEKSNPPVSEGAKRKLSILNKGKPWNESRRLAETNKNKNFSLESLDIVCDHYQICHHDRMREINKGLQECFSLRSLKKEFNVPRHVLSRHKKQCLSSKC